VAAPALAGLCCNDGAIGPPMARTHPIRYVGYASGTPWNPQEGKKKKVGGGGRWHSGICKDQKIWWRATLEQAVRGLCAARVGSRGEKYERGAPAAAAYKRGSNYHSALPHERSSSARFETSATTPQPNSAQQDLSGQDTPITLTFPLPVPVQRRVSMTATFVY
jgi:hypothetical protein